MSNTASFILLAVLLALSAFFSGTESAFTSLSPAQIASIKDRYGARGKLVARLTARPERLLTTVLIGNNLVNIGASALATQLTVRLFGNHAVGIMTGVLTLVVLIFAEVTPKQIAIANNTFICVHTARAITVLALVLRPVVLVIGTISRMLSKLVKGSGGRAITLEGVLHVIRQAENVGIIESYKSRAVKNLFRFSTIPVGAIMTHRTEMFSLERNTPIREAARIMADNGYARAPVYNQHPEQVVGVILARDLMRNTDNGEEPIRSIMVEPLFIPEHRRLDQALNQLQQAKLNMAVVLDEFGGVAGLVTIEDIVEEIVGEIYDEHETRETDKIIRVGDHRYAIRGDVPLSVINDFLPVRLVSEQNSLTLGGYLSELVGRIPAPGECISTPAGDFEVVTVQKNRIVQLHYQRPKEHSGSA